MKENECFEYEATLKFLNHKGSYQWIRPPNRGRKMKFQSKSVCEDPPSAKPMSDFSYLV